MKERRISFNYETKPVLVEKNGLSLWKIILFIVVLGFISKAIDNGIDQDIIKTLITSILK